MDAGKECPPQVICHMLLEQFGLHQCSVGSAYDGHRWITSEASDASGEAGSQQGCSGPRPSGKDMGVRSSSVGNVLHSKMPGNWSTSPSPHIEQHGWRCAEHLGFEPLELHFHWFAMTDGQSTCESAKLPSYQPVSASVISVRVVPMTRKAPVGHSKVPIPEPSCAAMGSHWLCGMPCSSCFLVDNDNSAQSIGQNSLVSAQIRMAAWAKVAWVKSSGCLRLSIQSTLEKYVVCWKPIGHSIGATCSKQSQIRRRCQLTPLASTIHGKAMPSTNGEEACAAFPISLDTPVEPMLLQWALRHAVSLWTAWRWGSVPLALGDDFDAGVRCMSLQSSTEAELKNLWQAPESSNTFPLVYSRETLAMNVPSGLERLESLFHTLNLLPGQRIHLLTTWCYVSAPYAPPLNAIFHQR